MTISNLRFRVPLFWFSSLRLRKIRFSVRSILILSALVVLAIWWLATPSATADRFVRAISEQRYDRAQEMFAIERSRMMLPTEIPILTAHATVGDLTWKDLLRGRRAIDFKVVYQGESRPLEFSTAMEAGCRGIHAIDLEERLAGKE